MRSVHSKPFWKSIIPDYFDTTNGVRRIFNRQTFFLALTGFCLVSAPFSFIARVLFCALASFCAIQYYRAKKVAEGLYVRRITPESTQEFRRIEIKYKFHNRSQFRVHEILVLDFFTGTKNPEICFRPEKIFEQSSTHTTTESVRANAGMGKHHFGPIWMVVSDPFGIFNFVVKEDEVQEIQITPKIEELPEIAIWQSDSATQLGTHVVQDRCQSVNYMGIREYSPGDPPKWISWRHSARHDQLYVKEFEKDSHTRVSILLAMARELHMGTSRSSTWESAKDIALSLAHQHCPEGNPVQLISDGLQIPFGTGKEHHHQLSLQLMNHIPGRGSSNLLYHSMSLIPSDSLLFWIIPVYQQEFEVELRCIQALNERRVQTVAIFLDALSYVEEVVDEANLPAMDIYIDSKRMTQNDPIIKKLYRIGAWVYWVDNQKSLYKNFVRRASQKEPQSRVPSPMQILKGQVS